MIRTTSRGIHPSDVIIKTAIEAGLQEIYENPHLLDFIFSAFRHDPLTSGDDQYGEAEMERAKKWFLETEIPVSMAYRADQLAAPMISITLEDSSEGPTTLGDVHYSPRESIDVTEILIKPGATLGPFTPKSFDRSTGLITLSAGLTTDQIHEGMLIVDTKRNQTHEILTVASESSFTIAEDTKANFTNTYVAPASAYYLAHMESLEERETYRIDLYTLANPTELLYLYAVVKFVLYKYKQELLEARGFERSVVTTTGLRLFRKSDVELFYTRSFMLSGFVRQFWPKDISPVVQGVKMDITVDARDEDANPFEIYES